MKSRKRTTGFAVWLCMLILLPSLYPDLAFGNDDMQKTTDELNKIEQELKSLDKKRSKKKYEKNKVLRNMRDLENNIKGLEKQVDGLSEEILLTDVKIYDAEETLKISEENIFKKKNLLDQRLRVMYKAGQIGYIEVLLGASSFEDLMSRADMLQKIYRHDVDLIQYMNEQKQKIIEKKKELETYKEERKSQKSRLEGKKQLLKGNMTALNTEKVSLSKDIAAINTKEEELEQDAKKLTTLLKSMKLKAKYIGGAMAWPAPGRTKITSPFGYRIHPISKKRKLHTGVDIGVPRGGDIVAAQSGTIIFADWYGGYGKCVMIDHGGGIVTLYGHNSKIFVKKGQKVKIGQKVAGAGSTGYSTGSHLHFEVRVNGEVTDPMKYIQP